MKGTHRRIEPGDVVYVIVSFQRRKVGRTTEAFPLTLLETIKLTKHDWKDKIEAIRWSHVVTSCYKSKAASRNYLLPEADGGSERVQGRGLICHASQITSHNFTHLDFTSNICFMCKKLATSPALQRSHLNTTKIMKQMSCGHNGKEIKKYWEVFRQRKKLKWTNKYINT